MYADLIFETTCRKKQLITKDELLDLVAVGKSVPGIVITNISMLFGYQVAVACSALRDVFCTGQY